jgi:N-acetyl-gamma-glutamylphosphate reductase
MKVGIINVTGYAGMELARLLSRHPRVRLTSVTGRSQICETIRAKLLAETLLSFQLFLRKKSE